MGEFSRPPSNLPRVLLDRASRISKSAGAEAQRDSATQPSNGVARNELPWDYAPDPMTTLKRLWPAATATQHGHNPVGVVKHRPPLPRVARPSQPWALLRIPVGILSLT